MAKRGRPTLAEKKIYSHFTLPQETLRRLLEISAADLRPKNATIEFLINREWIRRRQSGLSDEQLRSSEPDAGVEG